MPEDQVIRPSSIDASIAPFAFQHYARDFYAAYQAHTSTKPFSPARLFLLARSLELAAKAIHLADGRSTDDIRQIGHDLLAACDGAVLVRFGITVTPAEVVEVERANQYYENKGFEYFLFSSPGLSVDRSGPELALSGWPNRPDETVLAALTDRLLAVRL